MNDKSTLLFGFLPETRIADAGDAHPNVNEYPRLLRGDRLKGLILPASFDTSVHQATKVSGVLTGTSLLKLARRIAALEKEKLKVN
jgi:hypothetical protein